jgi:hypothetical protein
METVKYRNQNLPIRILPKGTLLFRSSVHPKDDIQGIPLKDGTRCVTPHYNVYFYPNPFMVEWTLGMFPDFKPTQTHVYKLTRDVKMLSLVEPSSFSRLVKNKKRSFLKRCSKTRKGCLPRTDRGYNPCFSDTMIRKYPDLVGTISIPAGDAVRYNKGKRSRTHRIKTYLHEMKDSTGMEMPPEIQLHPFAKRPTGNVILKDEIPETNYERIQSFSRKDTKGMEEFMEKYTQLNEATGFYELKNQT